jgi:hypothetical protein
MWVGIDNPTDFDYIPGLRRSAGGKSLNSFYYRFPNPTK